MSRIIEADYLTVDDCMLTLTEMAQVDSPVGLLPGTRLNSVVKRKVL